MFIKVQSFRNSLEPSSPFIDNPQNGRSFDHTTAIMGKHRIEMESNDWRMMRRLNGKGNASYYVNVEKQALDKCPPPQVMEVL